MPVKQSETVDTAEPDMEPAIRYVTQRTVRLEELRASDVPRGLNPDDVAIEDTFREGWLGTT